MDHLDTDGVCGPVIDDVSVVAKTVDPGPVKAAQSRVFLDSGPIRFAAPALTAAFSLKPTSILPKQDTLIQDPLGNVVAVGAGNIISGSAGNFGVLSLTGDSFTIGPFAIPIPIPGVVAVGAGNIQSLGESGRVSGVSNVVAVGAGNVVAVGADNFAEQVRVGIVGVGAGNLNLVGTTSSKGAFRVAPGGERKRAKKIVKGGVTFSGQGEQRQLEIDLTKAGKKQVAKLAKVNARRTKRGQKPKTMKVELSTTFNPEKGPTVTRTKVIKIRPGTSAVPKPD